MGYGLVVFTSSVFLGFTAIVWCTKHNKTYKNQKKKKYGPSNQLITVEFSNHII